MRSVSASLAWKYERQLVSVSPRQIRFAWTMSLTQQAERPPGRSAQDLPPQAPQTDEQQTLKPELLVRAMPVAQNAKESGYSLREAIACPISFATTTAQMRIARRADVRLAIQFRSIGSCRFTKLPCYAEVFGRVVPMESEVAKAREN